MTAADSPVLNRRVRGRSFLWITLTIKDFVLRKVSTNFVLKELSKLKVTKASGPDGITARLLNDAASSS